MSRKIIAVIKLAPGQIGYYDEVSGVYLTTVRNTGNVYQGMNTVRLQQAVKQKKLVLVSGSLVPPILIPREAEYTAVRTAVAKEASDPVVLHQEAKADLVTIEPVIKPVVAEEKATKKKGTKKEAAEEVVKTDEVVEAIELTSEMKGE